MATSAVEHAENVMSKCSDIHNYKVAQQPRDASVPDPNRTVLKNQCLPVGLFDRNHSAVLENHSGFRVNMLDRPIEVKGRMHRTKTSKLIPNANSFRADKPPLVNPNVQVIVFCPPRDFSIRFAERKKDHIGCITELNRPSADRLLLLRRQLLKKLRIFRDPGLRCMRAAKGKKYYRKHGKGARYLFGKTFHHSPLSIICPRDLRHAAIFKNQAISLLQPTLRSAADRDAASVAAAPAAR